MIALRAKEIKKLSLITGIPESTLQQLHDMQLLKDTKAIDILIAYERSRLLRFKQYKVSEIDKALALEYQVSIRRVKAVAHNTRKSSHHCSQCGRPVKRYADPQKLLCQACVIKAIEI